MFFGLTALALTKKEDLEPIPSFRSDLFPFGLEGFVDLIADPPLLFFFTLSNPTLFWCLVHRRSCDLSESVYDFDVERTSHGSRFMDCRDADVLIYEGTSVDSLLLVVPKRSARGGDRTRCRGRGGWETIRKGVGRGGMAEVI